MYINYEKNPSEICLLLNEVKNELSPTLNELEVKIGVVGFETDEDNEEFGSIKVMNTLDRLTKGYDAELLIDTKLWAASTELQRKAALDYFMYQLELVPNSEKAIEAGELPFKTDTLGRPKLKIKKGDWNSGEGYTEVVKRNKQNSLEYIKLQQCMAKMEAAKNDN